MPYWYYAGKNTQPIEIEAGNPIILTPRQRFHAPKAAVQHLLRPNPPLVKLLPDPKPRAEEKVAETKAADPSPVPKKGPEPASATKEAKSVKTDASGSKSGRDEDATVKVKVEKAEKFGEEPRPDGVDDANPPTGVVAFDGSDKSAESADEAGAPKSEGEEKQEKETSTSKRKRRRRSSSSSND